MTQASNGHDAAGCPGPDCASRYCRDSYYEAQERVAEEKQRFVEAVDVVDELKTRVEELETRLAVVEAALSQDKR